MSRNRISPKTEAGTSTSEYRHDSCGLQLDGEGGAEAGSSRAARVPVLVGEFQVAPLEAMAAGSPVLASRSSSIPEICGDAPFYFDPADQALLRVPCCMRSVMKRHASRRSSEAANSQWNTRGKNVVRQHLPFPATVSRVRGGGQLKPAVTLSLVESCQGLCNLIPIRSRGPE